MILFRRSGAPNCDGDSGQALVETALTLPVLLLMLIGAVELGRVAYAAIEVTNAAKAAVQYGAQNSGTAVDTTTMQTVATAEAADYNITLKSISFPAPVCSCVTGGTPTTPNAGTCSSTTCGGYIVQVLTVDTAADYSPIFSVKGLPTTFTVHGHAVQEVLR